MQSEIGKGERRVREEEGRKGREWRGGRAASCHVLRQDVWDPASYLGSNALCIFLSYWAAAVGYIPGCWFSSHEVLD